MAAKESAIRDSLSDRLDLIEQDLVLIGKEVALPNAVGARASSTSSRATVSATSS